MKKKILFVLSFTTLIGCKNKQQDVLLVKQEIPTISNAIMENSVIYEVNILQKGHLMLLPMIFRVLKI